MNTISYLTTFFTLYLLVVASAAPTTDSPAGQESSTTTVATSAVTTTSQPPSESSSTGPTETSNSSSPATPLNENISPSHGDHLKTSFTCYGRTVGYHADVAMACKVYHYCMLGEYNGESVYQRITYLCLNDSLFDEKLGQCVEPDKMSAACGETPAKP